MVEVLVLYYSRVGRTEALAKAVAEGVNNVKAATARKNNMTVKTTFRYLMLQAN